MKKVPFLSAFLVLILFLSSEAAFGQPANDKYTYKFFNLFESYMGILHGTYTPLPQATDMQAVDTLLFNQAFPKYTPVVDQFDYWNSDDSRVARDILEESLKDVQKDLQDTYKNQTKHLKLSYKTTSASIWVSIDGNKITVSPFFARAVFLYCVSQRALFYLMYGEYSKNFVQQTTVTGVTNPGLNPDAVIGNFINNHYDITNESKELAGMLFESFYFILSQQIAHSCLNLPNGDVRNEMLCDCFAAKLYYSKFHSGDFGLYAPIMQLFNNKGYSSFYNNLNSSDLASRYQALSGLSTSLNFTCNP